MGRIGIVQKIKWRRVLRANQLHIRLICTTSWGSTLLPCLQTCSQPPQHAPSQVTQLRLGYAAAPLRWATAAGSAESEKTAISHRCASWLPALRRPAASCHTWAPQRQRSAITPLLRQPELSAIELSATATPMSLAIARHSQLRQLLRHASQPERH